MTTPNSTPALSAETIVLRAFRALELSKSPELHRLRRGTSLLDAMMEPVFHQTKQRLQVAGHRWVHDDNLACALLLLPLVKTGSGRVGASLSRGGFSNLRFNQLLATETPDDLFLALQRALRFIEGQVSPFDVLHTALNWTESHKDRIRKQMLADYHQLTLPAAEPA